MPSSLRLHLPLHVRSQHVLKVVGKCMGVPYEQTVFANDAHRPVDFGAPASATNPWNLRFLPSREDFAVKQVDFVNDLSFAYIHFQDLAGNVLDWAFSAENEDEDYKLFYPDSTAVSLAAARRLLRFFGGSLKYHDGKEEFDETRPPSRAAFPPRPRRSGTPVSSDDRFDQFHNALQAVPLLTAEEILAAGPLSAHGMTPACRSLLDLLAIEAQHRHLATHTRSVSVPRRRSRL